MLESDSVDTRDVTRSVVISDLQYPFLDRRAFDCFLRWCRVARPQTIHILGDFMDCYTLSRFDKSPDRRFSFADEIEGAKSVLQDLRRVNRKATIIYYPGNHEDRLTRIRWGQYLGLGSLGCLDLWNLLDLKKMRIRWAGSDPREVDGVWFHHGTVLRSKSGGTASAMLAHYGENCICGHSHRLGLIYQTTATGVLTAAENGCLCNLHPEYDPQPNWQQGFTVIGTTHDAGGRPQPYFHQCLIINGATQWEGRRIS